MEKDVTNPSFTGIDMPDIDAITENLKQELLKRIQDRTPVKTGAARDGWKIEGDNIVNHVPYIDVLEYGSSEQAPQGMVRISMEEVPQIIDQEMQKLNNK